MKPQINALTSTRAFAAILVFIFHFGQLVYPFNKLPLLFARGSIAVSYFFVLSGFVLYISYSDKQFTYGEFIKKRLARIAPVYWVALAAFVFVYLYVYKVNYSPLLLKQIVHSALFIQAYSFHYALVLNTAAWSISVEMLFYFTFPFLLLFLKKRSWLFIVVTVLAYLATQVIVQLNYKADYLQFENFAFYQYNPIMHVNQFLVGMVGGFIFKKMANANRKLFLVSFFLFCVLVALVILMPANAHFEAGLLAPLFMIFILTVAINNPKFLNIRPLVFLGEISYGIYILQFPVRELALWFNVTYKVFSDQGFFYFSLAMLILVASLSYYLLEKPLRRKINAIGTRKTNRAMAGNLKQADQI